jgi:hypothetical protein
MSSDAAIADSNVVIAARETVVSVAPRDARLRLVNLPTIDFALRAAIRCEGTPVSLTLSIADTYSTVEAAALEGQRAVEAVLTVPPRQLALAASARFCIDGDPQSDSELLVPGFATAHASLRCEKQAVATAQFASAPLQLRLSCERSPAEEDQDWSPSDADEDASVDIM